MRVRNKLLIFTSVFVFLYAIYYWIVPLGLNANFSKIQELVKNKTGATLVLKNPKVKMGIIPSICFQADFLGIDNKINSPLSLENPKVKIRLLPLIFGKFKIAYFSCNKIDADLKIDKNLRIYLGKYLITTSQKNPLSIDDAKMNLIAYSIKINDEYNNKKIKISGDYFNLYRYNPSNLNFATNSKILINGHKSEINANVGFKLPLKKSFDANTIMFDGMATNINLADLSPYINKLSKNKVKNISGILNIEADTKTRSKKVKRITSQLVADNLYIQGSGRGNVLHAKNKLVFKSVIDVLKNNIILNSVSLKTKNINMELSGKIDKIDSKKPKVDLKIKIKNSKTQDFIDLMPAKNFPNVGVDIVALKKYGYFSDVSGYLNLKGKADKPAITGEVVAPNGYVLRPMPIPPAFVKVKFLGKKIYLDVRVPVSNKERVLVNGYVDLYGSQKADIDVASTQHVDLETVETILNPVHEVFGFDIGPVPIMDLKGQGNINLKVKGTKEDSHLFGGLNFYNATASFNGINYILKNGYGHLSFDNQDTHFTTKQAYLFGRPISIEGRCSLFGVLDFDVRSNIQNINDLIENLKTSPKLSGMNKIVSQIQSSKGKADVVLKITGHPKDITDVEFGKNIFVAGNIKLLGDDIFVKGSKFPVKNLFGNIQFDGLNSIFDLYSYIGKAKIYIKGKVKNSALDFKLFGRLNNNEFSLKGNVKNAFDQNKVVNAKFVANNFDISYLKEFSKYPYFPAVAKKYIDNLSDLSGNVNLRASIKNNKLHSRIKLQDISMVYTPNNMPLRFISGNLELNNDRLILYKLNSTFDSMPVLVDGMVINLFTTPKFNLYVNSKPTQKFIEKYLNKNLSYPLKVKGDVMYTARINGNINSFNIKTEVNLLEDSIISYMGSTIGDISSPVRFYLDANIDKNKMNIQNFQYDKLISSQNGKEFVSPQLNAKGEIFFGKILKFSNLKVKTQNPTDAKIFNIIFKKSLIKQGLFTSNLLINGKVDSPNIQGDLNVTGVDIPLLDTTIKDVSLDFKGNQISLKTKGDVFSNKVVIFANMKNDLTPPYHLSDVDIYLGNLDVNEIIKSLNRIQVESDMHKLSDSKPTLDITDFVVSNGTLKADSVFVRNIFAKNLKSKFSLSDKLLFSLKDFKFEIADGSVDGNFTYNLLSSKSTLALKVSNVNANSMAEALFDLPNQLYGSLAGNVDLSCNGNSHKTCMETLSGNGGFSVADGRMPKLGSMEYLLKAANLVKSGFTGVTLNSIIDLLSPVKTGNFENINGTFSINSGLADSVQIFTKGKDLSLFVTGTYNFPTFVANMEVFGRLSKKMTNVLGPVGNTSLNTLLNTIPGFNLEEANKADFIDKLNKIPGFELNDKAYRIFSADIYGDISGENYVQSFKWIE